MKLTIGSLEMSMMFEIVIINDWLNEQLESVREHVLHTKIRKVEAIGQASVEVKTLYSYKKGSVAVNDYRSLADEVIQFL